MTSFISEMSQLAVFLVLIGSYCPPFSTLLSFHSFQTFHRFFRWIWLSLPLSLFRSLCLWFYYEFFPCTPWCLSVGRIRFRFVVLAKRFQLWRFVPFSFPFRTHWFGKIRKLAVHHFPLDHLEQQDKFLLNFTENLRV